MLFQLISYLIGGDRRKTAKALAAGQDPDGDAATLDVLAALEKFAAIRPDPEAFIEALDPLQPRVYSISSSPKMSEGRVSLTVDTVRYEINKRKRLGVADLPREPYRLGAKECAFTCKRHSTSHCQPTQPIIMIGPALESRRSAHFCKSGLRQGSPVRIGSISVISAVTMISSTKKSLRLCASRAT
jgi:sulfite reductase (NADPH) flavoprotein alpha-component